MNILVANWIYGSGSTGYIVRDLQKGLMEKGNNVLCLTGVPINNYDQEAVSVSRTNERKFFRRLTRIGWPYFHGSSRATDRFIKHIEQFSPDIVHIHLLGAHCLNLFKLFRYLSTRAIPTVITNHAEVYYTGCCEHAFDCKEWIDAQCRKCNNIKSSTGAFVFGNPHRNLSYFNNENVVLTAVSPWLQRRVMASEMMNRFKCFSVMNGVDTSVFFHRGKTSFENSILNNPFVIHVTALFDPKSNNQVKGGNYSIDLAKSMPSVIFVVVASASKNTNELPENVCLYGKAKDQTELAKLYSNALLTIITSRRETFSMVTAESLCCGTPVVGFNAGGPESIALNDFSKFVEYGDIPSLRICIDSMLSSQYDKNLIASEASKKYSLEKMTDNYINVYNYLLKDSIK